jgi:hypothetical protein
MAHLTAGSAGKNDFLKFFNTARESSASAAEGRESLKARLFFRMLCFSIFIIIYAFKEKINTPAPRGADKRA